MLNVTSILTLNVFLTLFFYLAPYSDDNKNHELILQVPFAGKYAEKVKERKKKTVSTKQN